MKEDPMQTQETRREYGVPVVFDVTADSLEAAAEKVVEAIALTPFNTDDSDGDRIESWWLPEREVKHVDRNDNADMTLVRRDRLETLYNAWMSGDNRTLAAVIGALGAQIDQPSL